MDRQVPASGRRMTLRSIGIGGLICIGAFLLGMLVFNFVLMPLLVHQRNTVLVPDLRGMSEKQARQFTERISLRLRISREINSGAVPKGYVISQTPRPNDSIKEGRTVSVVLSLGPKMRRVPDLKGLSLRQSRILLTRHNLRVGRVSKVLRVSDIQETVLSSFPPPGRELTEGGAVDLLVAVGGKKARYIVPNLAGQDLLFIKEKLQNMGFRVGGIRYEHRPGTYPNTVIGQRPPPGTLIREGDSIELVAAGSD
ncbi:MAG: PASTA domain-containing protein [Candidatus Latescibacteria bacterium]|nr:PASTA domain-containing protein [Candidatus Latescibacterota bacterium]NIM66501.1 PASTA domain-containing protein [Candidatus Latescibacterota bacterium]NIO02981.1 PASTA domain-containing protein [Candidatus Latescibacterota bacterium]NIO30116.1 PASTA domain-containing protein [Candidatus Latescibacterota bacterium]NIO57735.1 PASTA domain-containing protein [Candidatus Latescibacterota bacterium]